MFSPFAIMIISIVLCCIFSVAALIFFILWIVSIARGGLQKACPSCSAMIPATALHCTHCGKAVPQSKPRSGSHGSFIVLFVVFIAAMGLSIAGIVYGAVSSDIGTSQYSLMSINLKSDYTSSGWNISFDSVKKAWIKKNISINNGSPKTLHVQSHLKKGSMRLNASQGDKQSDLELSGSTEISTIDLSKFSDGKVLLTVTMDEANGGGVDIWWN